MRAVLASAGDGKGEDRYYPLISAPRTQARLGRCSSAGPRPAAAGAAIRPCARARDRTPRGTMIVAAVREITWDGPGRLDAEGSRGDRGTSPVP